MTSDERCRHTFPPHGHVDDRCCLAAGHKGPHVCDPLYDEPCTPQTSETLCPRCGYSRNTLGKCSHEPLPSNPPCAECARLQRKLDHAEREARALAKSYDQTAAEWGRSFLIILGAADVAAPVASKTKLSEDQCKELMRRIYAAGVCSDTYRHKLIRTWFEEVTAVVVDDALNQATLREFISATPEQAEKIGRRIADAVRAAAADVATSTPECDICGKALICDDCNT